jgi:hypothetical protein
MNARLPRTLQLSIVLHSPSTPPPSSAVTRNMTNNSLRLSKGKLFQSSTPGLNAKGGERKKEKHKKRWKIWSRRGKVSVFSVGGAGKHSWKTFLLPRPPRAQLERAFRCNK